VRKLLPEGLTKEILCAGKANCKKDSRENGIDSGAAIVRLFYMTPNPQKPQLMWGYYKQVKLTT